MNLKIIGAGMAGLLAANMLRRHSPVVYERQQALPHNHSAILRFRSTAVSDATGIPFQKVTVRKGIWDGTQIVSLPNIPLSNAYSRMVTGEIHERSIWNLEPETRWLAPEGFVEQVCVGVDVKLNEPFSFIDHIGMPDVVISTLPMPLLMDATAYSIDSDFGDRPQFSSFPIYTLKARITYPLVNVFQTIYNASGINSWYRATIHNDEFTLELIRAIKPEEVNCRPSIALVLRECFGIEKPLLNDIKYSEQKFGKMLPIDESARQRFILWLTEKYNIYSLGRFATWRPILLDDVVKDIKVIEKMITSSSTYTRKLKGVSL